MDEMGAEDEQRGPDRTMRARRGRDETDADETRWTQIEQRGRDEQRGPDQTTRARRTTRTRSNNAGETNNADETRWTLKGVNGVKGVKGVNRVNGVNGCECVSVHIGGGLFSEVLSCTSMHTLRVTVESCFK